VQDYKYLRVAAMICATVVNTQTHRERDRHRERRREKEREREFWPVILLAQPAEQIRLQPSGTF